jgi:hypothetical protein
VEKDDLQRERKHLMRALKDIEIQEAAGLIKGDREAIKELLILRIANIDRALGNKPD